MTKQLTVFDYKALTPKTRKLVRQNTTEIMGLMKQTATGIVQIGQKLTEVKQALGHGHFGRWLKAEFSWSQDTAGNFMRVYERFGDKIPKISEFAPSALYLLANPSTPDDVVEKALARAEAGEHVTHKDVQKMIEETRPAPFTNAGEGKFYDRIEASEASVNGSGGDDGEEATGSGDEMPDEAEAAAQPAPYPVGPTLARSVEPSIISIDLATLESGQCPVCNKVPEVYTLSAPGKPFRCGKCGSPVTLVVVQKNGDQTTLTKCPQCRKPVATTAQICPNCGEVLQ